MVKKVVFVEDAEMPRLLGQLSDLLQVEKGLSDWDLKFLDGPRGLTKWDGNFSVDQAHYLDKMYDKYC